jgi:uncharacterized FAD-dependent dehydrogenase
MVQKVQLRLLPEQLSDQRMIGEKIADSVGCKSDEISFRLVKRSIDARKPTIFYTLTYEVYIGEEYSDQKHTLAFKNVFNSKVVHIIGAGPAGLFAALRCLELGLKPIVFERGKDVRMRRRDLAVLNKEGIVNPESNYCFGEGGAGTYSDGKLYTRSKKRGDVDKALSLFIAFGANPNIAIDAHPHIGTNKLPQIIVAMRDKIRACGGEVHFNRKLTDISVLNGKITHIRINETLIQTEAVILATGHSARDVFELLHQKKIRLESKPFALGVRIEHAQDTIDSIQYHGRLNDAYLPPASYSLVTQVDGKGVYSFCMCPGGIIAPCATTQNEVVTNGWSPSKRNNPFSNSGIVVSVDPSDFEGYENDPFVCLRFQKEVERRCWEVAGSSQKVPAQRMLDFMNGIISNDFPRSSYQPGIVSVDLNKVLPSMIAVRLKKAFKIFGAKMPGYLTNDAVLHAPESRTSSPICIPRDSETLEHVNVKGLYPCGEGAGYAGGIVSAAIDGMRCVDAINMKNDSFYLPS